MTESQFLEIITILVDSREQRPYQFEGRRVEVQALCVDDYSLMLQKSAIQTLISWSVKYKGHVIFADNREFGERLTLSILEKYARMFYQKYTMLVAKDVPHKCACGAGGCKK